MGRYYLYLTTEKDQCDTVFLIELLLCLQFLYYVNSKGMGSESKPRFKWINLAPVSPTI